jgi:hypothetical protein
LPVSDSFFYFLLVSFWQAVLAADPVFLKPIGVPKKQKASESA